MTRRPASSVAALAVAAAAVAMLVAPAGAGASGGLALSPARIDAAVRPGAVLPPITLRNDTGRRLSVRAEVVAAGQRLDGLPSRQPQVDARSRLATVSPARFTLRPGTSRRVRVVVTGATALRGRGSYGVVLFSATDAADLNAGGGTTVATRLRLGTNLLLRFPGDGRAHGTATGLRAEQAGPGRLRFVVRVRNDGRLHGRPQARLRIRDAAGRVVARATFPSGAILPGAQREFPADITERLRAGTYVARSTVRLGRRRSSRMLRFKLAGPNLLPTPDLRIGSLTTPSPDPDGAVEVGLGLINLGTAPAPVRGVLTVGAQGATPAQRLAFRADDVAPGARRKVLLRLKPVGEGAHELAVELRDGDRVVARRALVFRAEAGLGAWDRFRDWAAGHVELLLAGFGLAFLALIAGAAVLVRRLQRRLRASAAA